MPFTQATARLCGFLFIVVFFVYGGGNALIDTLLHNSNIQQPQNGIQVASQYLSDIQASKVQYILGALLMLINSVAVVLLGIFFFPLLSKGNIVAGISYVVGRSIEAVFTAFGVAALLTILFLSDEYVSFGKYSFVGVEQLSSKEAYFLHLHTLSLLLQKVNYWSYQIGMIALALGSIGFCQMLRVMRIIPVPLAFMLLSGYAFLFVGVVLECFGFAVGVMCAIPGGLCEITLGVWLLTKGVPASALKFPESQINTSIS
jgi:hypothetical protein